MGTVTAASYELHPACAAFPVMEETELAELAAHIREHGLNRPVTTLDGLVLDGRNRLLACELAGVRPRFETWKGKGSPTAWVVGENSTRRDLDASARAMIAAELEPIYAEEARARQLAALKRGTEPPLASKNANGDEASIEELAEAAPDFGKAAEHAGAAMKVSESMVEKAKRVKREDPELAAQVKAGKKKLSRAAQELRDRERREAPPRPMPEGVFGVILADPPWRYDFAETDSRRVENQYPTMTVAEIVAKRPPAAEDSVLFLWATGPKLLEALEVMRGWDFEYVTQAVWGCARHRMGGDGRVRARPRRRGWRGRGSR